MRVPVAAPPPAAEAVKKLMRSTPDAIGWLESLTMGKLPVAMNCTAEGLLSFMSMRID